MLDEGLHPRWEGTLEGACAAPYLLTKWLKLFDCDNSNLGYTRSRH